MGNLGQVFDFSGQSAQQKSDFDPLPPGWYAVEVTSGEVKNTKAGTGTRASIRFDVRGGAHDGRVVFGSFNLTNANPKAAEIGREQLGQMSLACGIVQLGDTSELLGKRLEIKLVIKAAEGQYEASNDIKGYRALKGAASTIPTFAAKTAREEIPTFARNEREAIVEAATAESPKAPAKSPPWAKRAAQ